MLTLIRSVVSLALVCGVAYCLFAVELGGRTLASHVADVWRSPVMQEKVGLVKDEMKRELEERLAASEPAPDRSPPPVEFDPADEKALDHLLVGK